MLTPLERLLWASEGNANVIASDSLAFEDARYSFAALEVIISFCHLCEHSPTVQLDLYQNGAPKTYSIYYCLSLY